MEEEKKARKEKRDRRSLSLARCCWLLLYSFSALARQQVSGVVLPAQGRRDSTRARSGEEEREKKKRKKPSSS